MRLLNNNEEVGLYCGSFDPFHAGHKDVVAKALEKVDRVIVAVCGNPAKQDSYLFKLREAGALASFSVANAGLPKDRVRVITSTHSMVNIALDFGVDRIIRGARDKEEEQREREVLEEHEPLLPVWCSPLIIRNEKRYDGYWLSSTMVKGMVAEGMDVSPFVSAATKVAMEEQMLGQVRIAIVGNPSVGKTKLCQLLKEYARSIHGSATCNSSWFPSTKHVDHYAINEEPTVILTAGYYGARLLQRDIPVDLETEASLAQL